MTPDAFTSKFVTRACYGLVAQFRGMEVNRRAYLNDVPAEE
jgi:hypothetical protein